MDYDFEHQSPEGLTDGQAPDPLLSSAQLLIHSGGDIGKSGRNGDTPLQRLRALYAVGSASDRASLQLDIQDMRGHTCLTIKDADPLVDLSLPPGTYHVSATIGGLRRGYTMTLKQDETFDLYLRLQQSSL